MADKKRLIHLDVILKGIETFKRCYEENEKELTPVIVKAAFVALSMVEQFVKETPTVDAVEVVRCKDCKWWSYDYCTNRNGAGGLIFNGDWFCCSGERKNNVHGND